MAVTKRMYQVRLLEEKEKLHYPCLFALCTISPFAGRASMSSPNMRALWCICCQTQPESCAHKSERITYERNRCVKSIEFTLQTEALPTNSRPCKEWIWYWLNHSVKPEGDSSPSHHCALPQQVSKESGTYTRSSFQCIDLCVKILNFYSL